MRCSMSITVFVLLFLCTFMRESELQQVRYLNNGRSFLDSHIVRFAVDYVLGNTREEKLVVCLLVERYTGVTLLYKTQLAGRLLRRKHTFNIIVPQKLVYFDSRNLNHPTDFFARKLILRACISQDAETVVCNKSRTTEKHITLLHPLKRNLAPSFTQGWELWLRKEIYAKVFHICKRINDVVKMLPSPVVSSGEVGLGFVRILPPLTWPEHVPRKAREIYTSQIRFTITSTLFLLDYCRKDLCNIISHRSPDNFLSPTVLINKKGHLHFQLHSIDGSGAAFLTSKPLPLMKWINFTFMVVDNQAHLTIGASGKEGSFQYMKHKFNGVWLASHSGFWSIGGYPGLEGFHGVVCCTTLYRHQGLTPQQIFIRNEKHDRTILGAFVRQHDDCFAMKELCRKLLDIWFNDKFMTLKRQCPNLRSNRKMNNIMLRLPVAQVVILESLFQQISINKFCSLASVGKKLYDLAMSSIDSNTTVYKLELAGCLGNTDSFYVASILYFHGIGVPISTVKAVQQQLYAAAYGNALAQLSLAYKHLIGLTGMQMSSFIAAGYYRAAAVTTRKRFEKEDHSVNTRSEMIRLDAIDLFQQGRGLSSNLINWLKIQAGWGSTKAQKQLAEILFHGQHGVAANQYDALHFYQDGAAQGDASAIYNLGVLHLKGIEVAKNETLAMLLFEAAARKDFTMAYGSMGYYELISRKNISGAIHFWKIAADLGDRDGIFNLGTQYEAGAPGVIEKDKIFALKLFRRSAEMGQFAACIKVADNFLSGDLIQSNVPDAIRYYRFVAENLPEIGTFLRKGLNFYLAGKLKGALLNYVIAAETGLALAFYNAALICEENKNNDEKLFLEESSLYFHGIAAELEWEPSLIYMGDRYWYGEGVPLNKETAALKYAAALKYGKSPRALFNLAYIIENSFPVNGLKFTEMQRFQRLSGNLSLARLLYSRCLLSTVEDSDGFYPCGLALVKMNVQSIYIQLYKRLLGFFNLF